MRVQLVTALVFTTVVAAPTSQGRRDDRPSDSVERAFSAGGLVALELTAGDYRITGSPDDSIHVGWRTRDAAGDPIDARVAIDVKPTEATVTVERTALLGNLGVDVDIQVPSMSDLFVELSAGDLRIAGVTGNKTISMSAGDLDVDVGQASDYASASASVWAGEVTARPFGHDHEGVFRSFTWTGAGRYRLEARLKAGEITFREAR